MRKRKPLDLLAKFGTGNVVEWNERRYIVGEVYEDRLVLLPLDCSNMMCYPSTTWPYKYDDDQQRIPDPTRTVQTVKHVCDNVHEYYVGMMTEGLKKINRGR